MNQYNIFYYNIYVATLLQIEKRLSAVARSLHIIKNITTRLRQRIFGKGRINSSVKDIYQPIQKGLRISCS